MKKTVCPGCSCLCDDVFVTVDSDRVQIEPSCQRASDWFGAAQTESTAALTEPLSAAELATRVQQATSMLANAKAPLITGLDNLPTAAQGRAWELADFSAAMIDIGFSNLNRSATLAFQRHGKITATIGEVASRADLIVYWFCDPTTSHPRLLDRVRKNHPTKKLVVFDCVKTATAIIADEFHEIPKQHACVIVQALRAIVAEKEVDLEQLATQTSFTPSQIKAWAKSLTDATYGVVYLGSSADTDRDPSFDVETDHWFRLVRELNNHTRFVMSSLRHDRNGLSAQNVLTSLTGFPFAISHLEAKPQFNGLEYSTTNVLNRRQCDALMYFGSQQDLAAEAEKSLNSSGLQHLNSIPKILIGPLGSLPIADNVVQLPAALPGWNGEGDFVRHDDVAIPLRPIMNSKLPSATEILQRLIEQCKTVA